MTRYTSRAGFYSIYIPESYSLEDDGDIVGIYDNDNGVGTIHISAYKIDESYDFKVENELIDFINNTDVKLVNMEINNNTRVRTEFSTNDCHWRYWLKFENRKAIFITYNCDVSNKDKERKIVDEIVASLEIN